MAKNEQEFLFRRSRSENNDDERRWKPYTHLENEMIQRAYEKGKTEIELDDFIINFKDQVHISKRNLDERFSIERRSNINKEYPIMRSDRFVLHEIRPIEKSFSVGAASFFSTMKTMEREYSPEVAIEIIESIRQAGKLIGKPIEGEYLSRRLKKVCGRFWGRESLIQSFIVHLYTMDSFIYRSVNHLMRTASVTCGEFKNEEDRKLAAIWGPYCALLKYCLTWHIPLVDGYSDLLLYRSANLTDKMIEEYRNYIGGQISWECFSSTTKNKNVALLYDGNTIFYIKVPMHPDSANRDISRYSQFPEEQEVLLVS